MSNAVSHNLETHYIVGDKIGDGGYASVHAGNYTILQLYMYI